jgi:hypothetical protein
MLGVISFGQSLIRVCISHTELLPGEWSIPDN